MYPAPILIISSSEALKYANPLRDKVNNLISAQGIPFHCETWEDFFNNNVRGVNQSFWDLLYMKSQELKKQKGYVVALWTFDDQAIIRDAYYKIPRGNVVLEYGLFYGALGPEYMFYFTESNKLSYTPKYIPSDLAGIRYDTIRADIDIDNAANTIVARLKKDSRTNSGDISATNNRIENESPENPLIDSNILNYNI